MRAFSSPFVSAVSFLIGFFACCGLISYSGKFDLRSRLASQRIGTMYPYVRTKK